MLEYPYNGFSGRVVDIEFHYYMTYLIAARAGFAPEDAAVVAQSAQEIDDNHIPISVSAGTPYAYESITSQTMDILRPEHDRKIYPIFHFIPGEPDAPTARRKDGLMSDWTTTPNSPLANEMLDTALGSGSLHRIGASAHAYADTWAHQNFLGKDASFNEMPDETRAEKIEGVISLMRVGHALAGHRPDIPGLIWIDGRLVDAQIDNTARFMDAANHLYRKLATYKNPQISQAELDENAVALVIDLKTDVGPSSKTSQQLDRARIDRYKARAGTVAYGGVPMPEYRLARWADAAFVQQRSDLKQQIAIFLEEKTGMAGDALGFGTRVSCSWKDTANYQNTDWWKFQVAIQSHLDECWGVLETRLPDLT
jgi:hypothetical protein